MKGSATAVLQGATYRQLKNPKCYQSVSHGQRCTHMKASVDRVPVLPSVAILCHNFRCEEIFDLNACFSSFLFFSFLFFLPFFLFFLLNWAARGFAKGERKVVLNPLVFRFETASCLMVVTQEDFSGSILNGATSVLWYTSHRSYAFILSTGVPN